ncbi:hypothetical protein [uncultured Draconibacterium sp.]|uniref:hypothetical protein n=1 Tax=uncultured Draconibacterium sp. TaxID=1573823 RepID=UPI0032607AD8
MELEKKPDFDKCMERIYAWYNQGIVDRAPIRFSAHNQEYDSAHLLNGFNFNSLKERWWNTEYQLELFEHQLENSTFNAETFPIFWPNLGPEVYTAFYGLELDYKEVTSYAKPIIEDWSQLDNLKLDSNNPYFKKIEEMTRAALERNAGKFMVGYTDLHPGMDCAAAFRDPEALCLDLIMDPDNVKRLVEISSKDFQFVFNYFDQILKEKNQLSVTWMGIPSFGKMHIPSCDFSSMISPEHFDEFVLPLIKDEIKAMSYNIFHLDGKGVANNIDKLLQLPDINAIQWVQGVGTDLPIMQWVPFIKKIQAAGKSVVVDLALSEIESFMAEVDPKGILLCINADLSVQEDIVKNVLKWN